MSACAGAVCKHVREYLYSHADCDFSQGMLEQALNYIGAVSLAILAFISPHRVCLTLAITNTSPAFLWHIQ